MEGQWMGMDFGGKWHEQKMKDYHEIYTTSFDFEFLKIDLLYF